MRVSSVASSVGLILAFAFLPALTEAAAPVARRVDTVDQIFGKSVPDPYRWMEGQENAEYLAWLKAQGTEGRAWLDATPTVAQWAKRLDAASQASVTHRGQHRAADRVFFQRLEQGKQGVLMVRLADGTEKVLLDPNLATADGGHASITNYSVRPDGKVVAVNLDAGGSEVTTVEFIDVDSGGRLPDKLDRVWGESAADWSNDGKTVVYRQMRAPSDAPDFDLMQNQRVKYHVMGTSGDTDVVIAGAGVNQTLPLDPREFISAYISADSDWAGIFVAGARAEFRLCLTRKVDLVKPGAKFNCIVGYDDAMQGAELHGDMLYLVDTKTTPNGRLIAVDLTDPTASIAKAKEIIPESKEAVITNLGGAHDALYLRYMTIGLDTFTRVPYDTLTPEAIATPFSGASYLVDLAADRDGFSYTLQGWTTPRQFLTYDPKSRQTTDLKLGANSTKDYGALIDVIETEVPSQDGTLVPVSILQPKGYKPDGKAISLLEAYGGYGISAQPFFDPLTLEWVTAGHVFVSVSVRGGGEKGNAWRLGGKSANKHKGVEDLIGAADYLVAKGYSKPSQIGIYGASMGGLIMGGAVSHYPTHFGAAIIHAGIVNPTRLAAAPNGANQFAETGDPATAEGYGVLYDMDPYLAIKDGSHYPPVLLGVGLNDNRVAPWMSGKFGAALLHTGGKVIFRTDGDSGHFGTSMNQQAAEKADHYAFLETVLTPKPGIATVVNQKTGKAHRRNKKR